MLRSTHLVRILLATGTGALIAANLVANPPAQAAQPITSITILLKAPNQAGLDRLATAHGLTHSQRVTALDRLLPSRATQADVTATLRAEGFTVTGQTAWTITAQAPQPTVAATFGARPGGAGKAAALPSIPAGIAGSTSAVLTSAGGPDLFSPLNACNVRCRTGTDFRNAYTAPNVSPTKGHDVNGPLTIATLQFAGWNPRDLTEYAASLDLPDPVADGQYTGIPVGQKTVPKATKGEHEGDEEVDLDQETLLATDPAANQRAYFSPNSKLSGYVAALSQVLADVTQSSGSVDGGDPHIVALSTSWGTCEDLFQFAFRSDTITTVENVLKSLTAAGVTVFGASGDDGVYDCGNSPESTKIAVDYPASSPEVVGVGGTRLLAVKPRRANNGHNWGDKAWSCATAETCQGFRAKDTGGSGGGESNLFRMPAYQSAGIGDQPFTTATDKHGNFGAQHHRLVPDIADDGDPATGFDVLTTDPSDVKACAPPHAMTCKPKTFAIGGTSLSAPEAAALFTDMVGAHGVTAGVGDIHDALYSAYAEHHGAFRDITTGVNGHQKDVDAHAAYELPVNAQSGYDTVTGLGAPLWPRIAPFIFAPAAPTAAGTIKLTNPHRPKHPTDVTATWSSHQERAGGSAASSASVTIARLGSKERIFHARSAPAAGTHRFVAKPGGNYLMSVTEHDLAGQASPTTTTLLVVPHDDRSFTFHGGWSRITAAHDYAGSHATTDSPGAFATASERGRRYVLKVRTGPDYGKLAIRHGKTTIGVYDLYSPTPKRLRIAFFGTSSTALKTRTFTFGYTGRKNLRSTGRAVDVDALSVFR